MKLQSIVNVKKVAGENKRTVGKWLCRFGAAALVAAMLSGCGKTPEKVEDFATYASSVQELTIPEGVKVVALGEATHGNNEFQQLKLDVFQQLVETTDVRAFVLEGDFGGCELVNQYIQGGEGDIKEITSLLGYRIYRTDNMMHLIEWMRSYNETASEDEKVRFYGMDMQYGSRCINLLKAFYENADTSRAGEISQQMDSLFGLEEDGYKVEEYDSIIAFLDDMKKDIEDHKADYSAATSSFDVEYALNEVQNLVYYMEYREKENFGQKYRDNCMFENVKWVLSQEENRGHGTIMISGHNGHITKNLSTAYTFLGNQLYEELGSMYFAIGTDYYNTECNVPNKGERITFETCSEDPLAYQVGEMPENVYYLDFAKAKESATLSKMISENMSTGSLGESYTPAMKYVKAYTHVYHAPEAMFDAMIYVYDATPIEVWQ